jgi:radical SAM superfamily enzyme YgiQ (UPF0313 family)
MSLISPVVSIFYSIFTANGIEMRFFDTSFHDMSEEYANSDTYMSDNLEVKAFKENYADALGHLPKFPASDDVCMDFRREVESFQPDVIMASAMESTVTFALKLLGSVRDFRLPHVLGGVFATFAPEKAIQFDAVDYICKGEGERVIVPLVRLLAEGKNPSGLPGIWTKNPDGTVNKGLLAPPLDLDEIPRFDVAPFHERRFYRAMAGRVYRMFPVETHRGCPLRCTFCNSPIQDDLYRDEVGTRYFRKKSVKKVMEDVRYFAEECDAEYFFFWADNLLSYSRAEIDEFARAYADYRIPFFVSSYPTTLDEHKVERLVEVGLDRLGMGIEHGNEDFRARIINRRYPNDKAIECIKVLRKYPIEYSVNNIVGFPTETPELHWDTVRLNRALAAHTSACSVFTPFHGTYLREFSIEKGYLKDPDVLAPTNSEESILEMPQFPKERIYGKARTFNLYLKFPESRWKDIEKAEALTPEGHRIWNELKEECRLKDAA